MIRSINDKVRDVIYNQKTLRDAITLFNNTTGEVQNNLFKLIYSDFFKMEKSYKDNLIFLTEYSPEYIMECCKHDYNLLSKILVKAKEFYDSSDIERILIMDFISKNGLDNELLKISNSYIFDKLVYSFNCDMNHIRDYIRDFFEIYGASDKTLDVTIEFMLDKIDEVNSIDETKYKKLILEFLRDYYKWSIYLKKNKFKTIFINSYDYLPYIEEYSLNYLLKNAKNNSEFLSAIIRDSLFYSIYYNSKAKKVDDYFEKNGNKKVKEKLKLN